MRVINVVIPPERDQTGAMAVANPNDDLKSTASSELSESLREEVLGKTYRTSIYFVPKYDNPTLTHRTSHYITTAKININETKEPSEGVPVVQEESSHQAGPSNLVSSFEEIQPKRDSSFDATLATNRVSMSGSLSKRGSSFEAMSANQNHSDRSSRNKTLKRDSISSNAMRNLEGGRYVTVETQTVAIQTVEMGIEASLKECRCVHCSCAECSPDYTCQPDLNDRKSSQMKKHSSESSAMPSKKRLSESSTMPSNKHLSESFTMPSCYDNYTDGSSQTVNVKKCRCNLCTCHSAWSDYDTKTTVTDQLSDNSDDSYSTDFFDLPYQNNEEYLKLLRELEKKLLARNRERVRKTMLEFEKRSRQNQNLERPVYDYSGDDNCSLLHQITNIKNNYKQKVCCKCGKHKRIDSDILQNEKKWDHMNSFIQRPQITQNSRVERSLHKSHWQLDPRSGEWVKVACFQQTDYASNFPKNDDCLEKKIDKTLAAPFFKKDCCCQKKKC